MRITGLLLASVALVGVASAANAQVDPAVWSQPLVLSLGEAGQAHLMGPLLPADSNMDAATACAQIWSPVVGSTYTIVGMEGEIGYGEVRDCTVVETSEGLRIVAPLAGVELPEGGVAVGFPTTSIDNFSAHLVDCSASLPDGELKGAGCSELGGSGLEWHPVEGDSTLIADVFEEVPFLLPRLEGGLSLVVVTPLGDVALWRVSQSEARQLLSVARR